MVWLISRICCTGAVTVRTPGWCKKVEMTVSASVGTVGVHRNEVGMSLTLSTWASFGGNCLRASV